MAAAEADVAAVLEAAAMCFDQLPPLIRLAHPVSLILEGRQSHSRSSRWRW